MRPRRSSTGICSVCSVPWTCMVDPGAEALPIRQYMARTCSHRSDATRPRQSRTVTPRASSRTKAFVSMARRRAKAHAGAAIMAAVQSPKSSRISPPAARSQPYCAAIRSVDRTAQMSTIVHIAPGARRSQCHHPMGYLYTVSVRAPFAPLCLSSCVSPAVGPALRLIPGPQIPSTHAYAAQPGFLDYLPREQAGRRSAQAPHGDMQRPVSPLQMNPRPRQASAAALSTPGMHVRDGCYLNPHSSTGTSCALATSFSHSSSETSGTPGKPGDMWVQ